MLLIREIIFQNSFENIGNFFKELDAENPDSKVIEDLIRALNQIYFYANGLQIENKELTTEISRNKTFLNKAILKRKEMAIENEDLRQQLKQLTND
jgi:hypothetical protein